MNGRWASGPPKWILEKRKHHQGKHKGLEDFKPQDPSVNPSIEKCPLLQRLPPELRELIYRLVWSPRPKLFLGNPRDQRQRYQGGRAQRRERRRTALTLRPQAVLGDYDRDDAKLTNWPTSASALLLTCKLIYTEASKTLYEETDFHLVSNNGRLNERYNGGETFLAHHAFLRNTPAELLGFVRSLTITHRTMPYRNGFDLEQEKTRREGVEPLMWQQVITAMSNIESLHIKLWVQQYNDGIVPLFRTILDLNKLPSPADLEATSWLQPILRFRALMQTSGNDETKPKLKRIRVDLLYPRGDGDLDSMWWGYRNDKDTATPPGWTFEDANMYVTGKWGVFMERLHSTMGKAIRDVLWGKQDPWTEHLEMLRKYYAWANDYHRGTGLFEDEMEERLAVHVKIRGPSECTKRRCVCGAGPQAVNVDWP